MCKARSAGDRSARTKFSSISAISASSASMLSRRCQLISYHLSFLAASKRCRLARFTNCPLHYTSPNAPKKRDVLGTLLLSVRIPVIADRRSN